MVLADPRFCLWINDKVLCCFDTVKRSSNTLPLPLFGPIAKRVRFHNVAFRPFFLLLATLRRPQVMVLFGIISAPSQKDSSTITPSTIFIPKHILQRPGTFSRVPFVPRQKEDSFPTTFRDPQRRRRHRAYA